MAYEDISGSNAVDARDGLAADDGSDQAGAPDSGDEEAQAGVSVEGVLGAEKQGASGDAEGAWHGALSVERVDRKTPSDAEWMKNKGYATAADMVKAMRGLEAKVGAKLQPPGDDASDEDKAAWAKAIGVGDNEEAYGFEAPEGWAADMALIGAVRGAALSGGMPVTAWNALTKAFQDAVIEQHHANAGVHDAERDAVFAEWGGQKDQNLALFQRGMKAFGFEGADLEKMQLALGTGGTRKLMEHGLMLGRLSGEDGFIAGMKQSLGINPAEARAELERLEGDRAFYEKLKAGDKAAKARHDRLLAVIAQDEEMRRQRANAG